MAHYFFVGVQAFMVFAGFVSAAGFVLSVTALVTSMFKNFRRTDNE